MKNMLISAIWHLSAAPILIGRMRYRKFGYLFFLTINPVQCKPGFVAYGTQLRCIVLDNDTDRTITRNSHQIFATCSKPGLPLWRSSEKILLDYSINGDSLLLQAKILILNELSMHFFVPQNRSMSLLVHMVGPWRVFNQIFLRKGTRSIKLPSVVRGSFDLAACIALGGCTVWKGLVPRINM